MEGSGGRSRSGRSRSGRSLRAARVLLPRARGLHVPAPLGSAAAVFALRVAFRSRGRHFCAPRVLSSGPGSGQRRWWRLLLALFTLAARRASCGASGAIRDGDTDALLAQRRGEAGGNAGRLRSFFRGGCPRELPRRSRATGSRRRDVRCRMLVSNFGCWHVFINGRRLRQSRLLPQPRRLPPRLLQRRRNPSSTDAGASLRA